jgi:HEAT repeat protein
VKTSTYSRQSASARARWLLAETEQQRVLDVGFYLSELRREKNPLVRWFLIKGLGMHRSPWAIDDLLQVFRQPDADFSSTSLHLIAAWSLGEIGTVALPKVLAALDQCACETEMASLADALGEIGDPSSVDRLKELFQAGSLHVQLSAALALAKLGAPARPALTDLLTKFAAAPGEATIIQDAIDKIDSNYLAPKPNCPAESLS